MKYHFLSNNKLFLSIIFIVFMVFMSCKHDRTQDDSSSAIKPNILFILVDDLGMHDLSITGSDYYETPNIDSLAAKSFRFTQGYAGSRVCSPSRATIMTGKFTARHGITNWIGERSGKDWRVIKRYDKLLPADYIHNLQVEDTTIAEAFQANGYTTFFAGKWHLGGEGYYPENNGFDINIGGWDKGSPVGGYFSPFKNPKLKDSVSGEHLSLRLANETADFLTAHKKEPFFAFLSFYAVHGPIQTSEDKWAKYRLKAKSQGLKDHGFAMERKLPIRMTQDNPVYAGLVETMDEAVGVVLNQLKILGLDKNTIVVFTSDNGGVASGDSFSTTNLPLRGGKGYQWEGGIREPYFIYVPGKKLKNGTSDYPVTGADFYPTLLDYAQIPLLPNQHKDGISLKPIIEAGINPESRPLYWHYPHYGNQGGDPSSIIREGQWKLIHYYEDDTDELYDLELDPGEQQNVAEKFPQTVKTMRQKLMNWLDAVGAKFPVKDSEFDPLKRKEYDQNKIDKLLPNLEKERMEMLSKDFKPNRDWWGSKVTND
ncbi:sulfatase [Gaetbulibacter sp. M240]|uniref:sulfatase n=1 Tax=Gaetbulibacter sp. M240 TaxID=3126511 RepID=UPI00374F39B0